MPTLVLHTVCGTERAYGGRERHFARGGKPAGGAGRGEKYTAIAPNQMHKKYASKSNAKKRKKKKEKVSTSLNQFFFFFNVAGCGVAAKCGYAAIRNLHLCYAMWGTGIGYAAMPCTVLASTMSGTEIAYGVARSCVPR
eukprot:745264-Rhodomonas_salina.2